MATGQIQFKRGDTFLQHVTLKEEVLPATNPKTYVPQDMTGWSVKSQVRYGKNLFLADCVITYTDRVNGLFEIRVDDTTGWPLKVLAWDVQFTTPAGQIVSTTTVEIDCQLDITLPVSV